LFLRLTIPFKISVTLPRLLDSIVRVRISPIKDSYYKVGSESRESTGSRDRELSQVGIEEKRKVGEVKISIGGVSGAKKGRHRASSRLICLEYRDHRTEQDDAHGLGCVGGRGYLGRTHQLFERRIKKESIREIYRK